jgi:secreted Zn-dependent insulinase-like peptidase
LNIEGYDELPCYGISFQILSSEWNPEHLENRINNFVKNYYEELKGFDSKTFNQYIDSAIKETLEKDHKLAQQFNRYWNEIIDEEYQFDIQNVEAQTYKRITHDDILEFYNKYLLSNPQYKTTSLMYGSKYIKKID